MMKKLLVLCALACFALTACSKDEAPAGGGTDLGTSLQAEMDPGRPMDGVAEAAEKAKAKAASESPPTN